MLAFPPSALITGTIPASVTLGDFVYEIEYEFSGMRLPGLQMNNPLQRAISDFVEGDDDP